MSDELFIDKKDKNKKYKGRAKSSIGVFALLIGIFCLIIYIMLIIMSQSDSESVVESITGLALMDFILAICGMIFSCKGCKERTGFFGISIGALLLNTAMFIVLISTYLIGV